MPKVIIDRLKLEITWYYHDLYHFDSTKVPCLGLIKDIVATLAQMPMKILVLDIVVTNIPPKFGTLLSRSCCSELGGSLQMDMSYAIVPISGGEHVSL